VQTQEILQQLVRRQTMLKHREETKTDTVDPQMPEQIGAISAIACKATKKNGEFVAVASYRNVPPLSLNVR